MGFHGQVYETCLDTLRLLVDEPHGWELARSVAEDAFNRLELVLQRHRLHTREGGAQPKIELHSSSDGVYLILVRYDKVGDGSLNVGGYEGGEAGTAHADSAVHLAAHLLNLLADRLALAVAVEPEDELSAAAHRLLEVELDVVLVGRDEGDERCGEKLHRVATVPPKVLGEGELLQMADHRGDQHRALPLLMVALELEDAVVARGAVAAHVLTPR